MVSFDDVLEALYEIQGNSDPNDSTEPDDMKNRLDLIYRITCDIMDKSGYQPRER